jgi:predicted kinase
MFNVCPKCGEYSVEKEIDLSGPFAICPNCHYKHPFLRLPLFIITGASGTGKSTVCLALVSQLPECVVLESDILWNPAFDTPEDNYRRYREIWLRLAKNIGQSGRPVVLAGSATPEQFENLSERRYFSTIHYLALVCNDSLLAERLQARPPWRATASAEFIGNMVAFNQWLKESADKTEPSISLFDTGDHSFEESVAFTANWVRHHLRDEPK